MKHLLPDGWPRPSGYSNGILAEGPQVFVAGMIGWDEEQTFADGFVGQFRQVLKNTLAVLDKAGAGPQHVVRMTWYITDLEVYRNSLADVGRCYRELFGRNYPAMAVIGVSELVEPRALIEIETTAVLPSANSKT